MWPLPGYDNTMVDVLKQSPPRRSYQLPQFMLHKSQYALRYSMVYFSSIWEAMEASYHSFSSYLIKSDLPWLAHFCK